MASETMMHEMALALKKYRLELEDTQRQLDMEIAVRTRLESENEFAFPLSVSIPSLKSGDKFLVEKKIGGVKYVIDLQVVGSSVESTGGSNA